MHALVQLPLLSTAHVVQARREAVQAVYESRPLAADHKVRETQLGQMDIS